MVSKPVVDRLEDELEGRAVVLRIGVMSQLGGSLAGRYGVRSVPTMIVLDNAGRVVYSQTGIPDRDQIVAVVEQLLGG